MFSREAAAAAAEPGAIRPGQRIDGQRAARAGTNLFLLAVIYFLVAAAGFSGFYGKWGFREDDPKFSFEAMVDGEAQRPFIYRQLLPSMANAAEDGLPEGVADRLTDALYASDDGKLKSKLTSASANDREYALRYHLIFYATFAFIFASLFAMRAMCLAAKLPQFAATVAPAIIVLAFPVLQSVGGYFYDFPELLFMSLAVLIGLEAELLLLIPLAAVATFNKESFLFFTLALYPLVRARTGLRGQVVVMGGMVAASALVYLWLRGVYAGNEGDTVQDHFLQNLQFYINPLELFGREITYDLTMLAGYSVVALAAIVLVAVRGWPGLSAPLRRHVLLAAAINLPLFLLFCAPGEMRNLSMLSMGLVLLLGAAMARSGVTSAAKIDPA